ncbi:ribosomal-processing cysteine protease Prp [Candidatus Allofournierella merdipullorum]|uniref:ribosomal-processing cysteine protease Prp n=1 Tax=Candidatus Allofournierella merdipullorum TaxID=2838595 RepID=UPI00374F4C09
MITVDLQRGDGGFCTLLATGHADYAPYGQDIVCASVSALIGSFCAFLEQKTKGVRLKDDGDTLSVLWSLDEHTEPALDVLVIGLGGVEAQYPEHLKLSKNF